MAGTEEFVEGSFTSGEKLNYRLALLFQINRIGATPARVKMKLAGKDDISIVNFLNLSKEIEADVLYNSVLLFEKMLSPYLDAKYKTARDNLEKIPQDLKKPEGEKKYSKLDNWKETLEYALEIFGLCMSLMRRENLLLQEEGEDVVE